MPLQHCCRTLRWSNISKEHVELPFSVAALFSFSIVGVLGWKYFFLQHIRQKMECSWVFLRSEMNHADTRTVSRSVSPLETLDVNSRSCPVLIFHCCGAAVHHFWWKRPTSRCSAMHRASKFRVAAFQGNLAEQLATFWHFWTQVKFVPITN